MGVISYLRARRSLEGSVFDRLSGAEQLKAESIDRWIDEQRRNVVFVAGLLGGFRVEVGAQSGPSSGLSGDVRKALDDNRAGPTPAHDALDRCFRTSCRRRRMRRSSWCWTSTAGS